MSTLQATNLKHASSASNNIVLDSSGNATFAGTAVPASSFLRNRIINGGMEIDQRNAGASVSVASGSTAFGTDRWQLFSSGSTQTMQRVAGTGGFQNALQITGAAGNTATNLFQRIEAANSFDLAGQTVTVSARIIAPFAMTLTYFLFRANTTDNFSGLTQEATGTVALNSGVNVVSFSAALSASATTGVQIDLRFGAFTSGSLTITGVQLEVGTTATPFERRQYGQELALCQRYYQKGSSTLPGFSFCTHWLKVTMRTAPTMTGTAGATLTTITVDKFRSDNGATIADFDFTASAEL